MSTGVNAGGDIIACDTVGEGVGGTVLGIGYIVFRILAIFYTPCIIGSPIFIPGGGATK